MNHWNQPILVGLNPRKEKQMTMETKQAPWMKDVSPTKKWWISSDRHISWRLTYPRWLLHPPTKTSHLTPAIAQLLTFMANGDILHLHLNDGSMVIGSMGSSPVVEKYSQLNRPLHIGLFLDPLENHLPFLVSASYFILTSSYFTCL